MYLLATSKIKTRKRHPYDQVLYSNKKDEYHRTKWTIEAN